MYSMLKNVTCDHLICLFFFFREKSVMVKCFNDQKPFIHRADMRTLYHNLRILSEDVKYVWHSIYKKPDHVWKSLTGGHVKCVPMLNTFIKVYMPWDIRLRSFVVAISIISILLCQHCVHKTQDEDKQNKGQSRIDNPETLATLDTQDTGRRQTKQKTQHRKLKRWPKNYENTKYIYY
jgi:hypothetical protein